MLSRQLICSHQIWTNQLWPLVCRYEHSNLNVLDRLFGEGTVMFYIAHWNYVLTSRTQWTKNVVFFPFISRIPCLWIGPYTRSSSALYGFAQFWCDFSIWIITKLDYNSNKNEAHTYQRGEQLLYTNSSDKENKKKSHKNSR